MSHFSKDLLDASPETLAALRDLLRGTGKSRGGRPTTTPPTPEGRFVGGKAGRPAPVRKRCAPSTIRA